MIDAVVIIEALAAEKRQFEEELDRKSKWQDGRASQKNARFSGVRRVVARARQFTADSSVSHVSEAPAGC